jgi:hypothetical protein
VPNVPTGWTIRLSNSDVVPVTVQVFATCIAS